MSAPLRIVLGEDQVLLRQGIARLLTDAGFEVVAEAGDAPDLLRKVAAHKPDVAIVDVQMPPDTADDGLRAALVIRDRQPDVGVLVLSQFVEQRYAVDLIGDDPWASATCSRTGSPTSASSRTRCGGSARAGSRSIRPSSRRCSGASGATTRSTSSRVREREVLELMAQGRSNRGIAEVLVVTPAAVEKHVTGIFSKLGVGEAPVDHRRVLAVLAFLRA